MSKSSQSWLDLEKVSNALLKALQLPQNQQLLESITYKKVRFQASRQVEASKAFGWAKHSDPLPAFLTENLYT